jgi:hypothetical protein
MKDIFFWDVTCCLATLRRNVLAPSSGLKMTVVISSETSVNSYRLTRHHIRGDSNIMYFIIRIVATVRMELYRPVGTSLKILSSNQ